MQEKTIWIDITMLLNWSGQLTGIQRVEYNLAKRFAAQKNVTFCIFDKVTQRCIEYDLKHVEHKVSLLQAQQETLQEGISESDIPSIYHRIAKKVYKTTVRIAPRKLIAAAGRAYRVLQPRPALDQELKEVAFKKGDVFLILSGDWSDNIFADWVKSTKTSKEIKVLQIIYDMLPFVYPAYFVQGMSEQFTSYMQRIFPIADGILSISKSTKRDIESFMDMHDINKIPVKVFRLGDDFVDRDEIKPKVELGSGEYMLCVGTVEARKNHLLLYYAVREAISRGIDIKPIVVVGKVGWLAKDFFYLVSHDPEISQKFIFLNRCTDQELVWLFRNCILTVYPSYYEGWGLPIAESLYYGKFCLSSSSSSMPEIAGDLIEYFSPNDPVSLLEKITKYTDNPITLKAKEEKIRQVYKPTQWDDTFAEVKRFIDGYL
jgi:hypothetical protein